MTRVASSVRTFRALQWSERFVLLQVFLFISVAPAVTKAGPLRRLAWRLLAQSQSEHTAAGQVDVLHARRYANWIDLAARNHFVPARCLQRSLILQYFLRRDRIPSRLRIGVRKQDGELRAHAWVEVHGVVVNDSPGSIAEFAPLERQRDPVEVRASDGMIVYPPSHRGAHA